MLARFLAAVGIATLATSPAFSADVRYFPVSTCEIVTVSRTGFRLSTAADKPPSGGGSILEIKDDSGVTGVTASYADPPNTTTMLYLAMKPGDKLQLCTGPEVQVTGSKWYQAGYISPISSALKHRWVFTGPVMIVKVVLSPYLGA